MIRDEELKRLIKYAQGMGVSVRFKPYTSKSGCSAEWNIESSEITIYVRSGESKISQVLSLIHEIGHLKGFANNDRKLDPKMVDALSDEDEKKKSRRRIYVDELKDTSFWETVYRDTDCKFDMNKLYKQKDFDIWQYAVYYETGNFPTKKEQSDKLRELRKKYG